MSQWGGGCATPRTTMTTNTYSYDAFSIKKKNTVCRGNWESPYVCRPSKTTLWVFDGIAFFSRFADTPRLRACFVRGRRTESEKYTINKLRQDDGNNRLVRVRQRKCALGCETPTRGLSSAYAPLPVSCVRYKTVPEVPYRTGVYIRSVWLMQSRWRVVSPEFRTPFTTIARGRRR